MSARLDHIIVPVNDAADSLAFYEQILGFEGDGMHGPFHVVRVSDDFILLFAEFATNGGMHLAFSFAQARFDTALSNLRLRNIPFGDQFDKTDNAQRPSPQPGAHGNEPGIYVTDPSSHLVEIRLDVGISGG